MNSTEIFNLLETIAATPSKNDKQRLLQEADCPELRRVLKSAYDPTINYYIKKVPSPEGQPQLDNFTDYTWKMLDDLSSRKVTGREALAFVFNMLNTLNLPSRELLTRIIKRDLRAGFSESTINKVFNGLIPSYPYMQYSLLSKVKPETLFLSGYAFCQLKMDGMYMSVDYYDDGDVVGLSRQGTVMPEQTLSNIFRHVKTFFQPGYQYHGEVLVLLDGKVLPREIANGILNSVAKGRELPEKHSLRYVVWDMVQLPVIRGEQSCKKPYTERYADLKEFHQSGYVQLVKTKIVHSLPEAFEAYAEALKAGQEGIMLKSGDLMWKDHKTTKGCKLKLEVDVDLEITGFTEGKGKNANTFGAISMQTSDGLLKVDVSGMSDDMRLYIHLNRDKLLGTIATVKGNDVTKTTPASIFLPRLVELRADKVTADSYQMVVDAFESAKQCERSEVNAKMGVK